MSTNQKLFILLILIIIGVYFLMSGKDESSTQNVTTSNDEAEMMDQTHEEMNEEDMELKDSEMTDTAEENEEASTGTYEPYSSEKLAAAGNSSVILFFKASWCPSCRVLDADIQKNIDAIPGDVTILEVNYDSELELRKKYGVTTQHTLVQVQSDGTLVKKWSGSPTLASLLTNI